jgi:hypothetical protein
MTLSEQARSRLADVVELQPTKNGELADRWGMASGSEVHSYLESELKRYYYRDDNSLIRATEEAAGLVDVEPGVEDGGEDGPRVVRVPPRQRAIVERIAGPDEEPQSVVSVLHELREEGFDPSVDDVRSDLRTLANKGVLTTVKRTVPTFRLAADRSSLRVEEREGDPSEASA